MCLAKWFILILGLISVNEQYSSFATDLNDIERISLEIERVNKRIEHINPEKEHILILGNADSGKSTLVQYLTETVDNPLLHVVSGRVGRMCIKNLEGAEASAIKDCTISIKTDSKEQRIYWDCPSFNDSRDAVQDIVNAYELCMLSSLLTAKSHRTKIVIVSALSELDANRSAPFLEMITYLGTLFQENIDQLSQGLCLVITKGERVVPAESMKDEFEIMQKEQGDNLTIIQRQMLQALINMDTRRISFFSAPTRLEFLSKEDKMRIEETFSLIVRPLERLSPHLSISLGSYRHIKNLHSILNARISEILHSFKVNMPNYTKECIQTHAGESAAWLRTYFLEIFKSSRTLHFDEENFQQDFKTVNNILKALDVEAERTNLEKYIRQMEMLEHIKPKDCLLEKDVNIWRIVSEACQYFEPFSRVDTDISNDTFIIKGFILGTSDINNLYLTTLDANKN